MHGSLNVLFNLLEPLAALELVRQKSYVDLILMLGALELWTTMMIPTMREAFNPKAEFFFEGKNEHNVILMDLFYCDIVILHENVSVPACSISN